MSQESQAEALEINLIRSIFEVPVASFTMTATVLGAVALATWTTHDPILLILLALFTPLAMARLVLMAVHWREVVRPELTITRARQLQRRCAVVYFAFAVVLGMFGSRVLQLPWPDLHMLIVAILIGYGAGMQPTSACGRESRFRT